MILAAVLVGLSEPCANAGTATCFEGIYNGLIYPEGELVAEQSAYALATNVARAFKLYGWCARIRGVESVGIVEGLPSHTLASKILAFQS
jgi:EvpB/VC_A0108, tail sheath N-terminal domain